MRKRLVPILIAVLSTLAIIAVCCVRMASDTDPVADALHFSHVACHAATVAYHLNRELTFDLATCTFSGDEEANKRLIRSNRAPWLL